MILNALNIYPIKSCRGISLSSAAIEEQGFSGDRRAMIVAEDGSFLSQRSHPRMAQIEVSGDLVLFVNGRKIPAGFSSERKSVTVWRDHVSARLASDDVNAALSDFLGQSVYLVSMDEQTRRQTDPRFSQPQNVSFADGFPYLITTTASLRALSQTAGDTIPMDRFRPNIVIETEDPWIEDDWAAIDIEGQIFDIVKPCARCIITTLDQKTGDEVGQKTMQALVSTRARKGEWGKGVVFGVNAIARQSGGMLKTGMSVTAHTHK